MMFLTRLRKAFEVGDRLSDGTTVVVVDPRKNVSLRVPGGIFGGESDFHDQRDVAKQANEQSLHGHKDWRVLTGAEAESLADVWDKVAPPALQSRDAPWFWGGPGSLFFSRKGVCNYSVCKGFSSAFIVNDVRPVAVIRSGSARP